MKELDFSAEKGKEEMTRLRGGMSDLLDERVGEHFSQFGLNPFQVAEVKEQLERQLGHVEAQLAAQKKVSFMLTVNLLLLSKA